MAFADADVGWMTDPARDDRLFVTHDAARHWSALPLAGVRAVIVVQQWVYAQTASAVYAAPTTSRHLRRVSSARGDVMTAGTDAVYALPTVRSSARTITQVRQLHHRVEPSPCNRIGGAWSTGLTEDSSDSVLVLCGSEPGTGLQLKPVYRQHSFGSPWHRVHDPNQSGYIDLGFSSSLGEFFTGGRSPLYLTTTAGRSWTAVDTRDDDGEGFFGGGFSDGNYGWVLAEDSHNVLDLSDDGGLHWRTALR